MYKLETISNNTLMNFENAGRTDWVWVVIIDDNKIQPVKSS